MASYDAIVVGAGTNGLACAYRLQAAGRRVVLLESNAEAGGGATSRYELGPGVRSPPLAHLINKLDPRVETGMKLARHGLQWHTTSMPTTVLSESGKHLVLEGAAGAALSGDVSAEERAAWSALRDRLMLFARKLAPFKTMPPPRLAKGAGNDWLKLLRIGLGLKTMGKAELREFMRLLLINVYDVVEDELQHPLLKGVLSFDATLGSWLGPRSPNSLILLLDRLAGEAAGQQGALALPKGGVTSIARAMAQAAKSSGVEIRSHAKVQRIQAEDGCVSGVLLGSEENLHAPLVVSAISPKTTLLSLVGPEHLDTGLVNRMRHQKSRGAAAKLHLLLNGVPDFRGVNLASRLVIAPSPQHVELAFNPMKYGEVPDAPVMELVVPSAFGEGPAGQHIVSAIVQCAPHAPVNGKDAARKEMLKASLEQLERHAPGIGKLVKQAELLMPYDIEERYGLVGGNWHHGELSVEQMLFLRPVPGLAHYRTPIDGLWLASAGCHPGGGISGSAGWNAAEAILEAQR